MKYDEKDVEEYLNKNEIKDQIEVHSELATIIQLLIKKEIITEKEFDETNNLIKEIIKNETKKKIKQELQNMEE